MAYDNLISRTDATALIPEDVSTAILDKVANYGSAALQLFRNVPMSRKTTRMPVLSALPTAYFVDGDTGLKQTTEVNWDNKNLVAEEIACIVPIPENVVDDSDFDAWASVEPHIVEAVGRTLDAAIFFGTNKPASWPTAIVPAAVSAGNVYARGTNNAAAGGIGQDVSELFSLVEADGYDVNGVVASRAYRGRLRSARNGDGTLQPEVSPTEVYGVPVEYPMRGLWPTGVSAAELIAGDFMEGLIGVRQDITYKVITEGVITDDSGDIIYNLPQQDMIALRIKARFAFQVANVINRDQPTEGSRYPFGVLRSPAS